MYRLKVKIYSKWFPVKYTYHLWMEGVPSIPFVYYVLPPSISLHCISLRRNDQEAANNADLYLRQGAAKESQPMNS